MLLDEFFINILAFSCELDLSLILDLFSSDSDSVEIPENSGGGARHDEDPENAIKVILTMLLTFLIFGLMFDDMYLSYLEDKKKKNESNDDDSSKKKKLTRVSPPIIRLHKKNNYYRKHVKPLI